MEIFQLIVLSIVTIIVILVIILANKDKNLSGWAWVEYAVDKYIKSINPLKRLLILYFKPFWFENLGKGIIYKILGVNYFGMILPTGGVAIRRLTNSKMPAYTLESPTINSAIKFRYRSCMFEFVHLMAIISQLPKLINLISTGKIEELIVYYWWNIPVNIFPLMYQRFTRVRIEYLINKKRI
jgi:hypothetical protein